MYQNHLPVEVALDAIDDNPYQTRLSYDAEAIEAIAQSIADRGLLQVPLARQVGERYQLAFGHSRKRAFDRLHARAPNVIRTMPLIVRAMDDETMYLHAWTENKDRKDLTAYEEATAIERSMQAFGWNQRQVAIRLGLSASTISNKLRLLQLPQATLDQVQAGQLSERQAAALLPLLELPPAVRQASRMYLSGQHRSAEELLTQASEIDSGTLRRCVQQLIVGATESLHERPWTAIDLQVPQQQAPTCAACPLRLASSHRCAEKSCFTAKQQTWEGRAAQVAADSLGLRAVGGSLSYDSYTRLDSTTVPIIRQQAQQAGCGNLVVWSGLHIWGGLELPDHPGCYVTCLHGPAKTCTCLRSLDRSGDPTVSTGAKKQLGKRRIRAEIYPVAQQAIRQQLARPTVRTWQTLATKLIRSATPFRECSTVEDVLDRLAKELVERETSWACDSGEVERSQRELGRLLTDFGAADPWAEPADSADTPALTPVQAARIAALGLQATWIASDDSSEAGWQLLYAGEPADQLGALDPGDLDYWLEGAAAEAFGMLACDLPGIPLAPGMCAEDRAFIADLVSDVAAAEVAAVEVDVLRDLQIALEGAADALDDATYAQLARRIQALAQQEVAV